ncbi:MAG TPA: GyrI-like domain-containing protein [Anaerolineae bacterium]
MLTLSTPKIITRGPYSVVGCYGTYEGMDEGPGWAAADAAFNARRGEVTNRADDLTLGFMYRPHRDVPDIPAETKACFIGVEVTDLNHVPPGMAVTHFSAGEYVVVDCHGDTGAEAAEGVGTAIGFLESQWLSEHGYVEGDACFGASRESAQRPPYIETVYMKLEKAGLSLQ